MKLYIVNNVLTDYTQGMVVVASESLEQARDICKVEFTHEVGFDDLSNYYEVDMNRGAHIVDYVFGGS